MLTIGLKDQACPQKPKHNKAEVLKEYAENKMISEV